MASQRKSVNWCLSLSAVLMLTSGCASIRPDIDYNPEQDFRQYNNYSWQPTNKDAENTLGNDLVRSRIISAIENGLAAKGYQKVTIDSEVDFLLSYHLSVETKFNVSTIHSGTGHYPWGSRYGYGYGGGVSHSDTIIREYKAGTLVIDIVDKNDNKLAWRGAAQSRLTKNISPEERTEKINKVVNAILDEFPPL